MKATGTIEKLYTGGLNQKKEMDGVTADLEIYTFICELKPRYPPNTHLSILKSSHRNVNVEILESQ